MKRITLTVILIAALALGGLILYKKMFPKSEIKVTETAKVERGDIRGILVETGIIKPQVGAQVKTGSRITGIINKMNVKVGDRVKKGDVIALIDDRDVQKQIERQTAALQAAKSTLAQVELTFPERIKEAQATHEYARINYGRERELLKHEYTTGDTVDKAKSQFEATGANLKKLREEYKTQLEISKAQIEEIAALLKQLEVTLSYTRISAPIDGVIAEVTLQEGETIVTGLQVANLVTILDPTSLEMWIYVDETDIGKAKVGQSVEYYVDTFPDKTFRGVIGKINPQPVTKDNIVYYTAVVEVPEADSDFLRPEMTSHVKIIFEEKKDVLTAPNSAVKFEEGRQIAYRVTGPGKVEKVTLKIGTRGEDRTEIVSGAKEGDELATKLILPVSGPRS